MAELPRPPRHLLLDIDGVLYVGEEPLPGAAEALSELRGMVDGLRLVTNTTSVSRATILAKLERLGFEVADEEVLTPAAMAVAYCREKGFEKVNLMVGRSLREDLSELDVIGTDQQADAVILGDLGSRWTAENLNATFTQLMGGAELIALQHNRYWRRPEGLVLDVGAYSAALEYASGTKAVVVGKPSAQFYEAALRDLGAEPSASVMVGDDVEGDVGGGQDAGIPSVLVRTGKYRRDKVEASGIEPTVTVDSVADLPSLLAG